MQETDASGLFRAESFPFFLPERGKKTLKRHICFSWIKGNGIHVQTCHFTLTDAEYGLVEFKRAPSPHLQQSSVCMSAHLHVIPQSLLFFFFFLVLTYTCTRRAHRCVGHLSQSRFKPEKWHSSTHDSRRCLQRGLSGLVGQSKSLSMR